MPGHYSHDHKISKTIQSSESCDNSREAVNIPSLRLQPPFPCASQLYLVLRMQVCTWSGRWFGAWDSNEAAFPSSRHPCWSGASSDIVPERNLSELTGLPSWTLMDLFPWSVIGALSSNEQMFLYTFPGKAKQHVASWVLGSRHMSCQSSSCTALSNSLVLRLSIVVGFVRADTPRLTIKFTMNQRAELVTSWPDLAIEGSVAYNQLQSITFYYSISMPTCFKASMFSFGTIRYKFQGKGTWILPFSTSDTPPSFLRCV